MIHNWPPLVPWALAELTPSQHLTRGWIFSATASMTPPYEYTLCLPKQQYDITSSDIIAATAFIPQGRMSNLLGSNHIMFGLAIRLAYLY